MIEDRDRGHRWRLSIAVTVAALAVGGCAAARGVGEHPSSSLAPPPDADVRAASLVVHAGETARAIGEVLAPRNGAVQFCPADRTEAGGAGTSPGDLSCEPFGVELLHADLHRLAHRRASAAGVTGYAEITGTYRDGTLTVHRQIPKMPRRADPPAVSGQYVPCAAPAGGWPSGAQPPDGRVQRYARAHRDSVVGTAYLNPGHNPSRPQWLIYVLTTGNPATVTDDLRAAYGSRLCVVQSRYSTDQLRAARRLLDAMFHRIKSSHIYDGGSGGLSAAEQLQVSASIAVLSATDAHAIDGQPSGLWKIAVWLKPVA